ncbi:hypothetical protein DY023_12745 [Microbacterium bovistercoris]|uniref:Uncharacterized protein n=1 Tax=Microbacterium bovistercoris TaxID=2293570 RepID=A0A371NRI6_9MICO|nr:hypothetical protein [Microbacterium bovistercoris]REJ04776.1 hypothetical protein DY023_12745 [Microbacterium bovistercoris]
MSGAVAHEPQVPISVFKANPVAYADTGVVVMVHNRPRMRVVPIVRASDPELAAVKARLRLLNALVDPDAVRSERNSPVIGIATGRSRHSESDDRHERTDRRDP